MAQWYTRTTCKPDAVHTIIDAVVDFVCSFVWCVFCVRIYVVTHSEHRFPAPSSTVTHILRASLSGTFLHSHTHTPSIAFRHLPTQSHTYSEHRFPAPSSTVTQTLRASLSGTFLHSHSHTPSIAFRHLPPNLPELVTPLKGHALPISAHNYVPRGSQRP